jgi:arylsulfatase A-like enzyme
MGPNEAVRMGNWKLVKQGQGAVGLYDLAADISESKDLAAQNPAKAQELRKALDEWEAGLAQPLWRQAGGQKKPRKRGARKEK